MYKIFKKFMAFLTLISMLSTSAWAFSPEVLFDDAALSQSTIQDMHLISKLNVNLKTGLGDAPLPEPFCDHACHISAHITAIETHAVVGIIPTLDSFTFKIESKGQFTNPVLESLYRPPALV